MSNDIWKIFGQLSCFDLISGFLMQIWLETLPPESRKQVVREIGRLINEERHEAEFALTVKATLAMGKKSLSQ